MTRQHDILPLKELVHFSETFLSTAMPQGVECVAIHFMDCLYIKAIAVYMLDRRNSKEVMVQIAFME